MAICILWPGSARTFPSGWLIYAKNRVTDFFPFPSAYPTVPPSDSGTRTSSLCPIRFLSPILPQIVPISLRRPRSAPFASCWPRPMVSWRDSASSWPSRIRHGRKGTQQCWKKCAFFLHPFPNILPNLKYNLLTKQMAVQFNDSQSRARAGRRVRMLIGKLSKQIERLFKMMGTDECLGAPCKNGGKK
jgi:hypothetical protein